MSRSRAMVCIMNKCVKCGVRILDETEVCPLCRCVVESDDGNRDGARYPDIRFKERKLELFGRIVLFISIVVGVAAVWINYMQGTDVWWSVAVCGGLGYVQLIVLYFVKNKHAGYRNKVVIGIVCGIAYVILVDYLFGYGRWSVNYVVPAAFLAVDVAIIVAMVVNLRSWQSYLLFQIFIILCSGGCVLLSLAGIITKPKMSYVAFCCSCFFFLAAFIIGGRRAGNELKRRFHVR